ncbi:hypothetical protein TPY_3679 [Sulfobacillus acidophilus TPY]|nr:hypothetical protein TPY_3679 [Sulfobacillus acidophilus TPY]
MWTGFAHFNRGPAKIIGTLVILRNYVRMLLRQGGNRARAILV